MAEITINPDDIRDALKDFAKSYDPGSASTTEVGHVLDAADGIAHVEGLPGCMANELVKFADGTLGLAQNLDENEIGVIVLGEFSGIQQDKKSPEPVKCSPFPLAKGTSDASLTRWVNQSMVWAPSRPQSVARSNFKHRA